MITQEIFNSFSWNTRRKIINFIIGIEYIEYKAYCKKEMDNDFADEFYVRIIMRASLPLFYLLFIVAAKTYYRKEVIKNCIQVLNDIIKTMFVAGRINKKMETELFPYLFSQE